MKQRIKRAYGLIRTVIGVDPQVQLRKVRNLPRFLHTFRQYRAAHSGETFRLGIPDLFPILEDFNDSAGQASGHYFFQDLWAARKIFERRPEKHIDIGSRIDGFVAHVLSFMPITVLDVRPMASNVPGLSFVQGDATNLAGFSNESVDSLSSLHAVEHFGLGRYGDPVDPDGWRKAIASLQRVLRPSGRLYFAVPVGRERLCFNAHRVFSPQRIVDSFNGLRLVSFSAVGDDGQFRDSVTPQDLLDAEFACGLFEFTK